MSTNEYNTGYSHVLSLKRLHASITPLGRVFGCANPYPHHCVFHTVPLPPPPPFIASFPGSSSRQELEWVNPVTWVRNKWRISRSPARSAACFWFPKSKFLLTNFTWRKRSRLLSEYLHWKYLQRVLNQIRKNVEETHIWSDKSN